MSTTTETATRTPSWSTWRGGIALVTAAVFTLALFWWIAGVQPTANGWILSGQGFVVLQVPYAMYNDAWIVVRILLGCYITVVFAIVLMQLLGTWRRLLSEHGGET